MDADDIWHPEKLEKQVAALLSEPDEVGLVYTWCVYIDRNGRTYGEYSANNEVGDVYVKLICMNFIGNGSSAMIRRRCLKECGLYLEDITHFEDKELFLRIAESYRFQVIPEFLVGYRQHEGSASRKDFETWEENHYKILKLVQQRHPEIPPRIFCWARSILYCFLCSRNFDNRRFDAAMLCFAKALYQDITCIIRVPQYIVSKLHRIMRKFAYQRQRKITESDVRRAETLADKPKQCWSPGFGTTGSKSVRSMRHLGPLKQRRKKFIESIELQRPRPT